MTGGASIVVKAVSVAHGAQVVLDGVDVTVGPSARIGVVGPNGAGKTTLLRLLAGLDQPDEGAIHVAPRTATVGYLPQEPDRRPGESLLAFFARRTGVADAQRELDRATQALVDSAPGADDAYSDALDRWLALGGDDLDDRVRGVCDDIGLPAALLDAETTVLSGGEAARASLASILLARFDVFLLDEPTNDLDFAGLGRLEQFVATIGSGFVIVSHDREFLERTVTSVLDLDGKTHHATLFDGGWSAYLQSREVARRHAREAYDEYAGKRDTLLERARRQRAWSEQGVRAAKRKATDNDKFVVHSRAEASEKQAAKARQTQRAIERLDSDAAEEPRKEWELRLSIAEAPRAGDVVATLRRAVVRRGSFTLGPVDLTIGWADRVVIMGANGAGKTTLLGALLGRVPLAEGAASLGPGVVLGEVDQARSRFRGATPVLDVVEAATTWAPAECRTLLAKFGLTAAHVLRPAGSLSPGERTRAGLALLQAIGVNCLVLDEPTNHLDLPAIEQLEGALDAYGGTLLLITHDRRMLEAVHVTRRLVVAEGLVHEA